MLPTRILAVTRVRVRRCDMSFRDISLGYVDGGDQGHDRELARGAARPTRRMAAKFTATAFSTRRVKRQYRRSNTASRATQLGRNRGAFFRRILELDSGRLIPNEGRFSPAGLAGRARNQKVLSTGLLAPCRRIRAGIARCHRCRCGKSQSISSGGSRFPTRKPAALSLSCALRRNGQCDSSYGREALQARARVGYPSRITPLLRGAFL